MIKRKYDSIASLMKDLDRESFSECLDTIALQGELQPYYGENRNKLCKREGSTSTRKTSRQLAQQKGFASTHEYHLYLVNRRGFQSYTEYQDYLAKRRGFASHHELRKYQASLDGN